MALFQSEGSKHQDKLSEEYLYGSVADEIANNHVSPGLWAKAFSEADGDEKKAQARYIKARVALLKSEQSAVLESISNRKPPERKKPAPMPAPLPIEVKPPAKDGDGLVVLFQILAAFVIIGTAVTNCSGKG